MGTQFDGYADAVTGSWRVFSFPAMSAYDQASMRALGAGVGTGNVAGVGARA